MSAARRLRAAGEIADRFFVQRLDPLQLAGIGGGTLLELGLGDGDGAQSHQRGYLASPSSVPTTWSCRPCSASFRRSAAPGLGSISRALLQLRQFGEEVVVAFDGAQAGQRQVERGFLAEAGARPAEARRSPSGSARPPPAADAGVIDRLAALARIAGVESLAACRCRPLRDRPRRSASSARRTSRGLRKDRSSRRTRNRGWR